MKKQSADEKLKQDLAELVLAHLHLMVHEEDPRWRGVARYGTMLVQLANTRLKGG